MGDLVVVTGLLGGPGAAVEAWSAGGSPTAWARGRFAAPVPRWAEGAALAAAGASAMIDVSDGLRADAEHVSAASGVRIELDIARVPKGPGINPETALGSGEEYELLATIPPASYAALSRDWDSRFAVPLTVVGQVVAHSSSAGSHAADSPPNGFDHFAPAAPTR